MRNQGLCKKQSPWLTYTYSDSKWKDLLTSYNGEDISYDSAGNPKRQGTVPCLAPTRYL